MSRYITIKNGIQCQIKKKNGILTFKHCQKIKTQEEVPMKKILSSLGIAHLG